MLRNRSSSLWPASFILPISFQISGDTGMRFVVPDTFVFSPATALTLVPVDRMLGARATLTVRR